MQSYINSLRDIYESLEKEHNFSCPVHLDITISNRLRSSNGKINWTIDRFSRKLKQAKITMSKAVLDEFGWEQFEKTFRHEVAHLANIIIYDKRGHNYTFKVLCKKFGGSMSSDHAGYKFQDCMTSNYVKTIKKWKYICPCGLTLHRAKRMSVKIRLGNTHSCRKCGTKVLNWEEIKIA